jgi:hypothetical protein
LKRSKKSISFSFRFSQISPRVFGLAGPAPRPGMFNWVRVRGLVTTTTDEDDPLHRVHHNIRVFAQVEGLDRQAIATQGDLHAGFNTREDACETGCLAACERASSSAMADEALEKCQTVCENACNMPDASGKFAAVVYGEKNGGKVEKKKSGKTKNARVRIDDSRKT